MILRDDRSPGRLPRRRRRPTRGMTTQSRPESEAFALSCFQPREGRWIEMPPPALEADCVHCSIRLSAPDRKAEPARVDETSGRIMRRSVLSPSGKARLAAGLFGGGAGGSSRAARSRCTRAKNPPPTERLAVTCGPGWEPQLLKVRLSTPRFNANAPGHPYQWKGAAAETGGPCADLDFRIGFAPPRGGSLGRLHEGTVD